MELQPRLVKTIRAKLQERLTRGYFVVKITTDTIEIEEPKNREKQGKLQKVIINDFPCTDDEYWSWRINLEKKILGLSTSDKTVDIALAILQIQKQRLDVYLIELKSRIDDHELNSILEQFQGSISRFYFLLSLNENNDHKNFPKLKIQFKGIVFYKVLFFITVKKNWQKIIPIRMITFIKFLRIKAKDRLANWNVKPY